MNLRMLATLAGIPALVKSCEPGADTACPLSFEYSGAFSVAMPLRALCERLGSVCFAAFELTKLAPTITSVCGSSCPGGTSQISSLRAPVCDCFDRSFSRLPKGGIKTFTVKATADYRLVAIGAKPNSAGNGATGGKGAHIEATFGLHKGDTLEVLVGQRGRKESQDTGGGGGTFVSINGRKNPLIVAGGGGGSRGHDSITGDPHGGNAQLGPDGADGCESGKICSNWASGGTGGGGGKTASGLHPSLFCQ